MKNQTLEKNPVKQILCFEKASSEVLHSIFNALNAEVDEALCQMRFPTAEGFFNRLGQGGILSSPM